MIQSRTELRTLLDVSKLTALGWSPHVDLESGIRQTSEWYGPRLDMRTDARTNSEKGRSGDALFLTPPPKAGLSVDPSAARADARAGDDRLESASYTTPDGGGGLGAFNEKHPAALCLR
jgi:hypothetical protein